MRAFLVFNAVVWLPYGLLCLFVPSILEGYATVVAGSATGTTEIRAMYGGLEAAIGCFAVAALVRDELAPAFVAAAVFLCGGLFLGRMVGVVADGGLTGYTYGALAFELLGTLWGASLLARGQDAAT